MTYDIRHKIPIVDKPHTAGDYSFIPINLKDPRATESLVKFSDYGVDGVSYYAQSDGNNPPYNKRIEGATQHIWGRKTVAEKLKKVNARLRRMDVELFVWDAYRPISCQKGLWDYFSEMSAKLMPHATERQRKDYVLKYVSDPTKFNRLDPTTWPVHSCGGAVDLTLRETGSKVLLDMGAGFDEMGPNAKSDAFECKRLNHEISDSDPRLRNRRLLHWAMTSEGFVNYPFEFWHYDFGDQMYILISKKLNRLDSRIDAWYGYMDSPEI